MRNQPKRDQYFMVCALISIFAVIVIIFTIPEQVIIDVATNAINLAIICAIGIIFKFMFFTDSSGKKRIRSRGSPYGSVWVKNSTFCFALIFVISFIIVYHFIIAPLIQSTITYYVYEIGRLYGLGIILGAVFCILIMGYQILRSLV